MGLFTNTIKTPREAAEIIYQASKHLEKPFSLAELKPDEDDYRILRYWAEGLSISQVEAYVKNNQFLIIDKNKYFFANEAFGLLFLMFVSEVARRHGNEGQVWPTVRERLNKDCSQFLLPQGAPNKDLRECIELAARRFSLRHVFGIEGLQNWYDSIFLQFGFTRKGIKRIPYWLLDFKKTVAIDYLYDSERQKSRSFIKLWEIIKKFRDKNINEITFKNHLADSPWVLPEWIDEITSEAKRKLRFESLYYSSCKNEENDNIPFLSVPKIIWNSNDMPAFRADLINLDSLSLDQDYYEIKSDDSHYIKVVERDKGDYYPLQEIEVNDLSQRVWFQLTDRCNGLISYQELELWDNSEDVNIFDCHSGYRIDPLRAYMDTRKDYILFLTDDLEIYPEPEIFYRIPEKKIIAYKLCSGWSPQTKVTLDGEIIWEANITGSLRKTNNTDWYTYASISAYNCARDTGRSNVKYDLVLKGVPQNIIIRNFRINGKKYEFKKKETSYYIKDFQVEPSFLNSKREATVYFRNGNGRTCYGKIPVNVNYSGAFITHSGNHIPLDNGKPICVSTLTASPMHVFPPDGDSNNLSVSNWAILEGNCFIKRLSGKKEFLREITGLGAPLVLKEGPYNSGKSVVLSEKVINKGIINDVITIPENGELIYSIYLNQNLEYDENYSLVLLQNDIYKLVTADNLIQVNKRVWQFRNSFEQENLSFLLGIAYNGKRIGAFWENEGDILAGLLHDPDSLEFYLELVKWLQLPVLGNGFKSAFEEIIKHYPGIVIKTWSADLIEQIDTLKLDGSSVCWSSVLREFFFSPKRLKVNSQNVLDTFVNRRLLKNDYLQSVVNTFEMLSRINPFLSAIVLKNTNIKPTEKKVIISYLANNLANVENGFDDVEYSANEEKLLIEAAANLQVDDNFLKQGVVRKCLDNFVNEIPLDENTADNLRLSLNVLPFSRYLTLKLLKKLL